jgi:hypothetical protein
MNNAMSESLRNLRNELTTWYMGLDDRTQYYFESAYTQNRRAIANGLGGWTVTDDELSHNSTLAGLLGIDADGEAADVVPHIAGAMAPVTEPANAQANQDFKLVWVDINYGTATSGYEDAVEVYDSWNNPVFQGKVDLPALDNGAQTPVQIDVPGLQAGTYSLRIVHNAGGGYEAAFALKNVGLCSHTDAQLTVAAAAGQ